MTEQASTRQTSVTLMYAGWQVWDGHYWPVRVGGDMVASIEFVQRSAPRPVEPGARLHIEHIDAHRYLATVRVLDTTDAVVLDLGSFRALRWIRPGEGPGDFKTGATVSLELSLTLNGWPDSPWTNRAADQHDTEHHWHLGRIIRMTTGRDDATEIEEAAMETVDSVTQYCLLECSRVE